MKTPEEILLKEVKNEGYKNTQDWLLNASSYNQEEVIHNAMEVYAAQFKPPKLPELRKCTECNFLVDPIFGTACMASNCPNK